MIVILSMIAMVVAVVIVMTFMSIVAVLIAMVSMIIVLFDMDLAIEVLRLSPNQRRSNSSFDGQTATGTQTPLENAPKQSIKRVMPGVVLKILFETSMTLEGDHRSELKFTRFGFISTPTMGTMGERWSGLNEGKKK